MVVTGRLVRAVERRFLRGGEEVFVNVPVSRA